MKKRILIPYATYGSGHKTIAGYIKKYFEESGNYECLTIDLLNYSIPVIGNFSKKTTEFIMTKLPSVWSLLYFGLNNKVSTNIGKNINLKLFKNKQLKNIIEKFNPDITICTHFIGADLISEYNKKGITNSKLVVVVTDYKPHNFWTNAYKYTDALIVSSMDEKLKMIKRGYKPRKVYTSGIPILYNTNTKIDKFEIKRKLRINNNKKTVLFFVGGGNGATYNLIYYKELLKNHYDCNILFMCGKNKKVYKTARSYISKYNAKNVKVFSFVTNINDFYNVSDFVITKPGGAQATECLLFEEPMLLVKNNGGQEVENKRFLIRNGCAKSAHSKRSFKKHFEKMLYNDNYLDKMRKNIRKLENRKSMKKLFEIVEKL